MTMARIACLGQQYNKDDFNGTMQSNAALAHWATDLGHRAHMVAFTRRGARLRNFIELGDGWLRVYKEINYYDVLNKEYDLIYFSTPGVRPGSLKSPIPVEFRYLKKPFIVMVHSEADVQAYKDVLEEMASHPMCKAILVNGEEAKQAMSCDVPRLVWFPCTMPDYLLNEATEWPEDPRGLLYAARLINWKLPGVLAALTKEDEFLKEVGGEVHVHGVAPGRSGFQLEQAMESMEPRWNRHKGFYNVFDIPNAKKMYQRRFFWDVVRTDLGTTYSRRMNLGAVEAIGQGCVPLVSPTFVPPWTLEFAIPCEFDTRNPDPADVTRKLRAVNDNYDKHRLRMRQLMLEGPWSYEAVKKQILSILDVALN